MGEYMGTPLGTFNHCTYFLVIPFQWKMKCFVVLFAIVASAVAESDPWLGYGYGGYGAGYASGYGYAAPAVSAAAVPVAAAAPVAVAAPVAYASGAVSTASIRAAPGAPTTSQLRKGDEYGNQAFG